MCVAATCRRRRRQMRIDKKYKRKDPVTAARRAAARLEAERQRSQRKK